MFEEKDLKESVIKLIENTKEFHKKLPDVIIAHGNAQFKKGEEHRSSSPETIKMIGDIKTQVSCIETNQKNMVSAQKEMIVELREFSKNTNEKIDEIKEACVRKSDLSETLKDYTKISYLQEHFLTKRDGLTKAENQPMKRIFWKVMDYVIIAVLASVLVMSGINLG